MLSKKEIKYIQSLCHKRKRDEDKVFVAEGPKLVTEILEGSYDVVGVYALQSWIDTNVTMAAPVTAISESELELISQLQTPNQVLVLARQRQVITEPVINGQLSLVLDGVQDPGNMGSIIRIADWFGINQLICSVDCADFYNAKVVQGTMGSIGRVYCWYKPLNEWLDGVNVPVYGALLQGDSVYKIQKPTEAILVIGNESKGIRDYILPFITNAVTIPRVGNAESLNAAVATGIILSHLVGG